MCYTIDVFVVNIESKLDAVETGLDEVGEYLGVIRDGVKSQQNLRLELALSEMSIQ